MKHSKTSALKEEVLQLQAFARSFADTLSFEYCYKNYGSETYSYCYYIDELQQIKINELKNNIKTTENVIKPKSIFKKIFSRG